MEIGKIIGNSLKYPFSNWQKFIILGIMFLIGNLYLDIGPIIGDYRLMVVIGIMGLITSIFASGYSIRIIKSSIVGEIELPEFNSWVEMFIDGFRYLIISFIYLIPAILIVFFAIMSYGSVLLSIITDISTVNAGILLNFGILILTACLYLVIILPILLMAVANMANNNKFTAAFKFGEIFNRIGHIGWFNLIIWYVVTGIIYVIILVAASLILVLLSFISQFVAGLVSSLLVTTYLNIYLFRSIALFYMSEKSS